MEGGTAEIVKKIFELFSTGKNKQEILRFLYENKIMPPAEYHKTGRIYSKEGEALKQWSKGTVAAILKNPVYREIVGEDRFLAAAERAEFGRKNGGQKREPPEKDIFSGILYCGDCGGKMQKRAGRTHRYYCPAADRIDAFSCTKKSITRQALTELIKKAVGWELSNAAPQADKQGEKIGKAIEKRTGERKQLLERKIKNITRRESEQYEKYYFGEIEKEKWEQEKKACEKKKELLQKEAENLLEEQKAMEIAAELKQQLLDGQKEGKRQIELTEELVHSLIGRIELYSPKRVKVVFAFSHAYVPQGEGR